MFMPSYSKDLPFTSCLFLNFKKMGKSKRLTDIERGRIKEKIATTCYRK